MSKTARITFLATPELKARIEDQARASRISLGEMIRKRFEGAAEEPDDIKTSLADVRQRLIRVQEQMDALIGDGADRSASHASRASATPSRPKRTAPKLRS